MGEQGGPPERRQAAFAQALLDHAAVPADLAQHAAVAAANDEHRLGIGMGVQRDLRDHLLVRVLVALCQLDGTVQHEHIPIGGRPENEDVLELGLAFVQHLLDLEAHGLTGPHHLRLTKPSIFDRHAGRRGSFGRKPRLRMSASFSQKTAVGRNLHVSGRGFCEVPFHGV